MKPSRATPARSSDSDEAPLPDDGPRQSALALLTRIPKRRHAGRWWFKIDRIRAIDQHIDYFGARWTHL